MSSLNASLATALSGLAAEQGAMQATTNNVANVNTTGYSREEPVLGTCEVTSRTKASSSTNKIVSVPPSVSFSATQFHPPASSTPSMVCTHIADTSTIACQPSDRRFHAAPIHTFPVADRLPEQMRTTRRKS
jgi:flagellar basal body rod protein FlgC